MPSNCTGGLPAESAGRRAWQFRRDAETACSRTVWWRGLRLVETAEEVNSRMLHYVVPRIEMD